MNIVFHVHLNVYKLKISTIKPNLQMFQGPFILSPSQEILLTLPRFTGSQEKNTALPLGQGALTEHTHIQVNLNLVLKTYFHMFFTFYFFFMVLFTNIKLTQNIEASCCLRYCQLHVALGKHNLNIASVELCRFR